MLSIIVALVMRTDFYMQYVLKPQKKKTLFNIVDFLPCFGPEAFTFWEGII